MNKSARTPEINEAESIYSSAAKAELTKKYDQAFRLYIKSAEIFLHLSRSAEENERDRTKWKGRASQALERAEKIKSVTQKSNPVPSRSSLEDSPNTTLTPVGIDHFSHRQQHYVLQRASSVNGHIYPPWDESRPDIASVSSHFNDPDGQPALSPEQIEVGTAWIRPEPRPRNGAATYPIRAEDIIQHIVTDCSVCASLCVCLDHARRFQSKFALNDLEHDESTGRCDVKVMFNGTWRRIVIDDKLPHHPTTGSLMCMTCHSEEGLNPVIWPSHIEKAYMKLMGGYDFPGSNSSIDLHALGGWIPEQLVVKSEFEREKTWTRILNGFSRGQCMLTLGTGCSKDIRWGHVRLLSSHSYAVLNVEEDDKDRVLTVLDSWVPTSEPDNRSSRSLFIPWSDVLATFEGIYLSWDPQLWSDPLIFHGIWVTKEGMSGYTHEARARFSLCEDIQEHEIWVLLTRHVRNSRNSSSFIALKIETEDEEVSVNNGIGSRVDHQGVYTNSTHVLTKCRLSRNQASGILNVLASYDGQCQNVGFTLTIYYSAPKVDITWDTTVVTPSFTSQIEGQWAHKSAGGNPEYPTFMVNPQYRFQVHGHPRIKVKVSMTLQTVKDLPVNISALWSSGERIFNLSQKDMIATSGSYRYGHAKLSAQLTPGDYSVVLSTFEPQKTGPYTFSIDSTGRFDIAPIPQEGAGMYSKVIRGSWDTESAVGGPSSRNYMRNPIYEIECPSPAQIKVRLQLVRPGASAPLNVTLLPPSLTLSSPHIATSGAYDDAISGVVTPQVSVDKGKYWVVPSTYSPGVEAAFQLLVYSSVSVVITARARQ